MRITRSVALSVVASLGLIATGAFAADLPSKSQEPIFEEPPVIPVFSWTGGYVGLEAGYGFGRDNARLAAPGIAAQPFSYSPNGLLGGAFVGYNHAFADTLAGRALVVGLEADLEGADYARGIAGLDNPVGGKASTRSDIKGSLRARVGVGAERVLYYATGGLAIAGAQTRYDLRPLGGDVREQSHTIAGYTIGAGVEYALMNSLSVRAEYRRTSYNTFTDALDSPSAGLAAASVSHRETDHRLQAGISYKLGGPSPLSLLKN